MISIVRALEDGIAALALAAMVVHLGLTGLFAPRDPDPYAAYYAPRGVDGPGAQGYSS